MASKVGQSMSTIASPSAIEAPDIALPAMGREIYYFKTGFTKSQRADSARADGPGILTFFS